MHPQDETLLVALKAVADESRLALLRLLHQREYTVGELAATVSLSEPTVSHHLAKLRNAELVTLRMAGTQRFYRLNDVGLNRLKECVTVLEQNPPSPVAAVSENSWITALDWPEDDKKVLRDYTHNGKIARLPSKQGRLMVLLRWLATHFEVKRFYSEAEVNAIIKAVYEPDYVGLRRDLVDMGYLHRERGGGNYWLAE